MKRRSTSSPHRAGWNHFFNSLSTRVVDAGFHTDISCLAIAAGRIPCPGVIAEFQFEGKERTEQKPRSSPGTRIALFLRLFIHFIVHPRVRYPPRAQAERRFSAPLLLPIRGASALETARYSIVRTASRPGSSLVNGYSAQRIPSMRLVNS